jgi:hypothetical protein
MTDLTDCLNQGVMRKTHASTNLNPESSRSHTIFKIILRYPSIIDSEFDEASLSIVDLAGSEKVSRAETTGKEFKESCNINQSLTTLSVCLSHMRHNSKTNNEKMKKVIPHRESQLTKLLYEYFQGGENIAMIANINPSREDLNETLNVINYASLSREIKPSRCRVITNPSVSNKKGPRKIQDKGFTGNEKSDNSDFYSDEENIFPNSAYNTSLILNQVGSKQNLPINQIGTGTMTSSNREIEAMNEKIKQLERQNLEIQSSLHKVKYESERTITRNMFEVMKGFTHQMNKKDNITSKFLQVLGNFTTMKQAETTFIRNPYLDSSAKKLVKVEDLDQEESQGLNNQHFQVPQSCKKCHVDVDKIEDIGSKNLKPPQINFMIEKNINLDINPTSSKKIKSDQIENGDFNHRVRKSYDNENIFIQSSDIIIFKSEVLQGKDDNKNITYEINQNPFLGATSQNNNNLILNTASNKKYSLNVEKSNQAQEDIQEFKLIESRKMESRISLLPEKISLRNSNINGQKELEKVEQPEAEIIQEEFAPRKYKKSKKRVTEKTSSTNVSSKEDYTDQSDFSDQNNSNISSTEINKANDKKKKKPKKKKSKKEISDNFFSEDEEALSIVKTIREENEEEEVKNQDEEEKRDTFDPEPEPKGKSKKGKTKSKKNNNTKKTKKK